MTKTDDQNFILKENQRSESGASENLPVIDFSTFIFSLNSSALVHLGAMADPISGEKSANLIVAKQTIDILGLLEEKTRGNLDQEESNLLRHILHELRLQYVTLRKRK